VAALAAFAGTAFADATPVQLILTYMPNVSNTGTTAASGIAELVLPEGEVRVSAAGLPRLEGAEEYVAWVLNTETNHVYRLGSFNSQETGTVRFEEVLPDAIPDRRWNLFLITVEKEPEPSRPSGRHSIAGMLSNVRPEEQPLPAQLPNTGGADELSAVDSLQSSVNRADWLANAGLAALVATIAGGAGYVAGRRTRP
jgi:hypothetical protein